MRHDNSPGFDTNDLSVVFQSSHDDTPGTLSASWGNIYTSFSPTKAAFFIVVEPDCIDSSAPDSLPALSAII